jgi:ornithine cyclodeaminase/alanine dehydrogenase-like protein (mu-crystallin family)
MMTDHFRKAGLLKGFNHPIPSFHPLSLPGNSESFIGIKTVSIFPENARKGLSAIAASYLLLSRETGQPLATMDGTAITLWRTACTSALAAGWVLSTKSFFRLL